MSCILCIIQIICTMGSSAPTTWFMCLIQLISSAHLSLERCRSHLYVLNVAANLTCSCTRVNLIFKIWRAPRFSEDAFRRRTRDWLLDNVWDAWYLKRDSKNSERDPKPGVSSIHLCVCQSCYHPIVAYPCKKRYDHFLPVITACTLSLLPIII